MYENPQDLSPELRRDLADWLLAVADSKRVLGLRYGEWATGAPELEADVTIAAMAQYELGHTRLLRGVLGKMEEDPRTEARLTDQSSWRNMATLDRSAPTWIEVVALNGLTDALLTINLEAATNGNVASLAQRLRKAVSEERYHALHAEAWFERMWTAPDDVRQRFAAAITAVWNDCLVWCGPADDNSLDRLAAAGVLDGDAAAIRERFIAAAQPLLADLELDADPDLEGWDPVSRRVTPPDFDDDSFAMITGAHARAMGVQD